MRHYAIAVAALLIVAGVGFMLGGTVRHSPPPPEIQLIAEPRAPEEAGTVRRHARGGHRTQRRRTVSRTAASEARRSRARAAARREARRRPAAARRTAPAPPRPGAGIRHPSRGIPRDAGDGVDERQSPAAPPPGDDEIDDDVVALDVDAVDDEGRPAPAPVAEAPESDDEDDDAAADPAGEDGDEDDADD
jgi:hypothetical protein